MSVRDSLLDKVKLTAKWKEFQGDEGEKVVGIAKVKAEERERYIQRTASPERLGRKL